jgi:hypothetical protein
MIALLASFGVMLVAAWLLAGVGTWRRRTQRMVSSPDDRAQLTGIVGETLATVVEQTDALRNRMEDVAENGRQMIDVEKQIGDHGRRPLWRQLEDASYEQDLDKLRQQVRAWVARVDGLGGADREILERLGLSARPLGALPELRWSRDGKPAQRKGRLDALQGELERSVAWLVAFVAAIRDYRVRVYR